MEERTEPQTLARIYRVLLEALHKSKKEPEMSHDNLVGTIQNYAEEETEEKRQITESRNPRKQFSEEDDTYIKENYGKVRPDIIGEHLQVSASTIYRRAKKLGLGKIRYSMKVVENTEEITSGEEEFDPTELDERYGTPTEHSKYQQLVILNGWGKDLPTARKTLLDVMTAFAERGFVAQGGISHVIQTFSDDSSIHYMSHSMVREVKKEL